MSMSSSQHPGKAPAPVSSVRPRCRLLGALPRTLFEDGAGPGATAKEAIDFAILRANMTAAGQQSANRFEIARDGRRVGVVMLARPAYRLGEAINLVVDFTGAEVPCYAVHSALETTERVDPTLALRSEASVHRVTRKIFVSSSESTFMRGGSSSTPRYR